MAREKNSGRKPAMINPLNEDLARAGDGHGLVRAALSVSELTPLDPPGPGAATNAISLGGGAYTQNFNTLVQTGTSGVVPADWFFAESGASANALYSAGTGTSTAGDTYSYGVAGVNAVTERAFGGLQSGNLVPTIGASFANNTGATITNLLVSYFGEQWRLGVSGGHTLADRLDFEISFNATSLTSGTWTAVDALDFVAPINSGTTLGFDGNATANRVAISNTITGLSIANGATFWIRWVSFDASGADDGLAIDDFSMSTPGSLAINDVTTAEGTNVTTDFAFTVTRSGGSSGAVGATWTLTLSGNADGGDFSLFPLTGTVSFANGETSKQIIVSVRGDTVFEPDETFTILLSAPTGGVAIGDGTGLGTIANDDPPPNQNPAIAGLDNDSVSWTEDVSGPAILDANALLTVTDADSADFNGGTLTVSVSANGVASEDVLSLANQPGSIELSGGSVLHNGIAIGTWTGGTNGAALVFTFNAAATPLGVTALMRNLTYDNSSQDPAISQREIQYVLTDGDGGSTNVHSLVVLAATDDNPVIGNLDGDSVSWQIGGSPVLIDLGGDATVTDLDSPEFPDFLLRVSSSHGDEDAIGIAEIGGVTVVGTDVLVDLVDIGDILFDGSEGLLQIQLSGLATPDYVARLLRAITFANADGTPTVGAHTLSVGLFDPNSSVGGYAETVVEVVGGTLSVGNLVFLDANNNGVFDAGDSGIDGIAIELRDGSGGGLLATAVTSGGGLYSFTGLFAGNYYLLIDAGALPPGLISVPTATDPDDDVDNDNNGVYGPTIGTAVFTLTAGGEPGIAVDGNGTNANFTVDFGFVYTPPTIDLDLSGGGTGFATSYTEGGPGVPTVDVDVDIVSPGPVDSVTITLTDFQDGDELFLSGLPGGEDITVSDYDPGTGIITVFRNGATLAELEEALRHISYRNTGLNPTLDGADAERTIAFVANAGAGPSNTAVTTIAITAINSPAIIGGTANGNILEDSVIATGGQLTISDPDGPDSFVAFGPVAGSGGYGNFSLAGSGAWTYAANAALIQFLGAGITATDTIDAFAADGTAQALTVTITGVNDAAAIDGDDSGAVTEDGATSTSGTLTIDDVDTGESSFQARNSAATAYGTFSIDADGHWSYQLDNSNAAVQALDTGDSMTDTIEVRALDGTSHQVVVTINGVDEPVTVPPGVDLDGGAAGIHYGGSFTESGSAGIGASIQVTQGTFPITGATIALTDGLPGDSLSIVGTLPLGITNISGNDQQIQLVGIGISAAQWAAALGQIVFTSSSDNPDAYGTDAARTINVELSDGFTLSATAIATIAIVAVNDAPAVGALDGDSVLWTEGDPYVLLDQNMPATVFDPDNQNFAGGFLSVGVQVNPRAEDEFFVLDIFPGVGTIGNDVYVDGAHIGTITSAGPGQILTIGFNIEATAARVATLIDYIAYRNVAGDDPTAGARSVSYLLNDGDGGASGGVVTVNVAAVNDTPVVTTIAGTTAYAESVNAAPGSIAVDNALTVADADDTALAGATVSITSNFQAGQDILAFNNNNAATFGNIAASYDAGGGVLTLNSAGGTATVAQWQAALRAVTYSNSSEEPSQAVRTISFTVNDGAADSAVATRLLSVTAQNDSPSGANATVTINEDATFTFTAAHFGFSDVDGDAFAGVRFGAAPVGGTLYFDADGAGGNAPVAVASFPTTTYSAADIAAGRLTFVPILNLNGTGAASIGFTVVDNGGTVGAGQNADTTPNTLSFNIISVNDAPSGADKTITINEDAAYTLKVADFGFSDVDGNGFEAVIFSNSVAGGTLYINGNPMTNVTLVYLHTIQSGGVVFVPAANETGAVGSLTFTVRDDGGFANGGQAADTTPNVLTFSMTAVNDAPVNSVPGAQSVNEDASLTLSTANGNALSVADVDATTLTVTLSVAHGTLTLASTAGLTFSDAAGDATMTFSGTAAAINAALGAGLIYNPNANYNGPDAIGIVTTDGGQTGTGPVGTDSDSVAISIAAVNDAPSGANAAFTINEDSAFTFAEAHFGFSDPVEGDDFLGVVIATIPSAGTILYDGAAVTAGQFVSLHDIALGKLSFVPAPDANGAPYGSFTFQVRDDGGAGNGGQDTDQSPNTLSFNVTTVNDAPVNSVPGTQSIDEDQSLTLSTANGNAISVADVDATTLTVTLSVAHGTLIIASTLGLTFSGGSDGTADASMTFSGTAAAINAALGAGLTYAPAANFNGGDAISVVTTDNGQTGTGPVGTDSDSIAISIAAVNDAPAGASSTIVINEDNGRVLTAADFGFSDIADGNAFAGVVLTSLPTAGFLIYDPDGAGGLPGVLANVGRFITAAELALGALTYFPASHANGAASASFTFQVRDGGGTANGGQDTDQSPNTITFDVNPVNDAPSGTSATIAINEDASRILTQADFGFSDPVEGHGFAGVVIATLPGNGTLLLNGVAIAAAGTFVSAAQIGAGQLVFAPGLNGNGVGYASFDFQVRDAGGTANGGQDTDQSPNSLTFNVAALNDAPTLDLNGAGAGLNNSASYVENAAPTLLAPAAVLGDVDSANFDGGSVHAEVVANLQPSDVLQIVNQGTGAGQIGVSGSAISYEGVQFGNLQQAGASNFTVLLNSNAGVAAVQALVRALSYFAPTELPAGGTRSIVVSVADGDGGTTSRTVSLAVTPVSDAPSGTDNNIVGSEDDPYVFTAADFGFSDPGEGHDFFAVRITTLATAGDILLNGVAVLAGDFIAVSAIDAGMLTFRPDPDSSGAPYASFTFQVQDSGGTANGGQDVDQTPNTITIAITPDNLAPALDLDAGTAGVDAALTYTENGPATAIAPSATLTDDSADFAGGTIVAHFALNGAAGDRLSLQGGGGVAVSSTDDTLFYGGILIGSWGGGIGGADLVVQLNASATAAAVAAVLRAIAYANISDDPSVAARTIAVAVTDGEGGTASAQAIVTLVAVDDAAVARDDGFTLDEAGSLSGSVFADHGAGADSDVDGPALSVAAVNGSSPQVGQQIMLASGALLTLNANGSFAYATNHAFDRTPAGSSGASNTPAHDSFTYTLAGGGTATVTLVLTGLDTDDTLFGSAGADVLAGGNGNDIYFLDNGADQVVEAAGQGFDTVFSSAGYALAAGSEVEVLSAVDWTATAALNFAGNGGANIVYGNAGANTLNGGGGADVLIGFGGDDLYFVDTAADIVIEGAGQGFDSVFASASYALAAGAQVEVLSAVDWTATNALDFTGNAGANVVYGNAGANSLDGGGGADVLIGFGGNDVYVVDTAADIAIEYAGQGYDTVYASASHALAEGSQIEVLSTINWAATTAINLTGNGLGNNLYGNAGANVLNGGGGADLLTGFGGADTFAFTTALGGGNVDSIADFTAGTDKIALDDAVFTAIGGGTLAGNAFVTGTAATDADDRIIYNSATGALLYDADGNGAGAAVQFATLTPGLTLTAGDFQVI